MGKRRKKSNKRGVIGRRWKRSDRPLLAPGYVDPTGLLTVINPDVGTTKGDRYASARCGCGCNMVIQARIDNLRAGKVSCPTRRKQQKRSYMVTKEHLKNVKLLGTMLSAAAAGLPATAIEAGLKYAERLTSDTALQNHVKATSKPDLASRDFKRAAEVIAKYGKPVPVPTKTEPIKSAPQPASPIPTFIPTRDKLRALIPYLDVSTVNGKEIITFGRVPDELRKIDYQPIYDLLVKEGIIARFGVVTEKGNEWLQQATKSS